MEKEKIIATLNGGPIDREVIEAFYDLSFEERSQIAESYPIAMLYLAAYLVGWSGILTRHVKNSQRK